MDLFLLRRRVLSIFLGRIQPPDHPPNLSKNLVLVNCCAVLALYLLTFSMNDTNYNGIDPF